MEEKNDISRLCIPLFFDLLLLLSSSLLLSIPQFHHLLAQQLLILFSRTVLILPSFPGISSSNAVPIGLIRMVAYSEYQLIICGGRYQDLFLEGSRMSELLDTLDQLGFLFVPVLLESFVLSSDPYIMQTQQYSLGSQTVILILCCAPIQ